MEIFQPNEVANLAFGIIAAIIAFFVFRKERLPDFSFFYSAFGFILGAYFFTVLEGVLWGGVCNFLEHLSYAAAGICFLAGCLTLKRKAR